MKKVMYAGIIFLSGLCFSQETGSKMKVSFFDGIAAAGYVDHGAFLNFTGPNISMKHKGAKFILGMLPSLRIQEDRSSGTKNSSITPNLGVGLTVVYKKIAFQVPMYYNTKTTAQNGDWKVGLGLGYRFQ